MRPTTATPPGRSTCAAAWGRWPGRRAAHGAHDPRRPARGAVRTPRHDGRRHSPWVLRASVVADGATSMLTMHLHYGGGWRAGRRAPAGRGDRALGPGSRRSSPPDCGPGREAAAPAVEPQPEPEEVRQRPGREHLVDRPGRHHPALAHQQGVGEAPGISSTWWVTSTVGGGRGRRPGRPGASRRPPGAQVEAGGRLVEQHQAGVAPSERASRTRWRSPDDSRPKGRSARSATPMRSSRPRA